MQVPFTKSSRPSLRITPAGGGGERTATATHIRGVDEGRLLSRTNSLLFCANANAINAIRKQAASEAWLAEHASRRP